MNPSEILDGMKNKLWLYKSQYHKISSYRINENRLLIATDKTVLEFDFDDKNGSLDEIVKQFLPVEENDKMVILSKTFKNMPNLAETLLKNIEKIKKDKDFIPQANAIKSQVDSILNLAKLELQIRKMNRI